MNKKDSSVYIKNYIGIKLSIKDGINDKEGSSEESS